MSWAWRNVRSIEELLRNYLLPTVGGQGLPDVRSLGNGEAFPLADTQSLATNQSCKGSYWLSALGELYLSGSSVHTQPYRGHVAA